MLPQHDRTPACVPSSTARGKCLPCRGSKIPPMLHAARSRDARLRFAVAAPDGRSAASGNGAAAHLLCAAHAVACRGAGADALPHCAAHAVARCCSRSAFNVAFAADNNIADITAKATSQTICTSMAGTAAGALPMPHLDHAAPFVVPHPVLHHDVLHQLVTCGLLCKCMECCV
jgi:hypothetical protein